MPDWDTLQLFIGAIIAVGLGVGGFVGTIVWWLASQIREIDKALSALDASFEAKMTLNRHDMRGELQGEVAKTDNDLEARRREIQDLAQRVIRLEARLNGNHKAP